MSKKSNFVKVFDAPSLEQIAHIELQLESVRRAARKPRKRKVVPVICTVVRCLEAGKSSRSIAAIVKSAHAVSISKDTILRFSRERDTLIRSQT